MKTFIKIYLWLYGILTLMMLTIFGATSNIPWMGFYFLVFSSFMLTTCVGLYKYSYDKKIKYHSFWEIYFFFLVLYEIFLSLNSMRIAIYDNIYLMVGYPVISIINLWTIHSISSQSKNPQNSLKKIIWILYFVFILISIIIHQISIFGEYRIWEILDFPIMILDIWLLYAFIWKKKILEPVFWRIYFVLNLFYLPADIFFIPSHPRLKIYESYWHDYLFLILLWLPYFYALYMYGFKQEKVLKK